MITDGCSESERRIMKKLFMIAVFILFFGVTIASAHEVVLEWDAEHRAGYVELSSLSKQHKRRIYGSGHGGSASDHLSLAKI